MHHPKQTLHKAEMQLKRIYMNLLGPIKPVGKGVFARKFMDEKTTHKTVYLFSTSNDAIHSPVRYAENVAISNGLPIQHLRSDEGG